MFHLHQAGLWAKDHALEGGLFTVGVAVLGAAVSDPKIQDNPPIHTIASFVGASLTVIALVLPGLRRLNRALRDNNDPEKGANRIVGLMRDELKANTHLTEKISGQYNDLIKRQAHMQTVIMDREDVHESLEEMKGHIQSMREHAVAEHSATRNSVEIFTNELRKDYDGLGNMVREQNKKISSIETVVSRLDYKVDDLSQRVVKLEVKPGDEPAKKE